MISEQKTDSNHWYAGLRLRFRQSGGETILAENTHEGPLRVQRTFQEADGSRHVYILHPPGGYVAGDIIDIQLTSENSSHVVATSPGASKFYRCAPGRPPQQQTISLIGRDQSLLEWLPAETIFFRNANTRLLTNIQLSHSASFIGWEICCLGRTASGESFDQGDLVQTLTVRCEDELLHREHFSLSANDPVHTRPWGLGDQPVFGTLVAKLLIHEDPQTNPEGATNASRRRLYALEDDLQRVVALLRTQFESMDNAHNWSVTAKNRIILVRYLGNNSETCKAGFSIARQQLLKHIKNIEPVAPRIWAT
jgi:urease accessory protein